MKRPRPAYLTQRSPSLPLDNHKYTMSAPRPLPPIPLRRRSSFMNHIAAHNTTPIKPTRTHSYDDSCISTSSSGSSSSSHERRLLVRSGSSEDAPPPSDPRTTGKIRRRRSHLVVSKQLKRRKSKRKSKRLHHRFRHINVVSVLSIAFGLFVMSFALTLFKEHPDIVSSLVPTSAPRNQRQQPLPTHHRDKLRRTRSRQEEPSPNKAPPRVGLRGSNDEPTFERYSAKAPTCKSVQTISFTVVTQLSWNRLWMLEHHCKRWPSYFSLAVFLNTNDSHTESDVLWELDHMGCDLSLFKVSVVNGSSDTEYPVNMLRNKALSQVETSHVVYLDVDFWPSVDLYDHLQLHLDTLKNPKNTLVMPAFQLNRQCRELRECPESNVPKMPNDKSDLLDLMVKEHAASAFDPTNYGGHGSTKYQEWLRQSSDELVEISCVNSNRYEPYLVFRYCRDLPPFQDAFTGYGKNKMTWIMQLRRSGYRFYQLGTSFVVHYPHLDSKARLYWNGGDNGVKLHRPKHFDEEQQQRLKRAQVDRTFIKFRKWLEEYIPDQTIVGKCKVAMNDDARLWVER